MGMLFLLGFVSHKLEAQVVKPDSNQIYKDLKSKSKKTKLGKFLYDVLIVRRDEKPAAKKTKKVSTRNPFELYKHKAIRNILVQVMDPFGFSVNDTVRKPVAKLEKYGNHIHVSSHKFLIRNQLLFNPGDSLDPLEISESERILRAAPFINDAHIYARPIYSEKSKTLDSVDVIVVVQDKWSLLPESGLDPLAPDIRLTEQNFLGFGNTIRQSYGYNFAEKTTKITGKYGLFNIRKSFLNTDFNYVISKDINSYGINIDRPFYSPLTRWAGGYTGQKVFTYFRTSDTSTTRYPINYFIHDGWLAKSWQISNPNSIKGRSTSIVLGGRVAYSAFTTRPAFELDSFYQNLDQTLFIGSLGVSRREFYKEKYLYRFGANEDVPIGYAVQLKAGYLLREVFSTQFYTGISASMGGLSEDFGYLASRIEYGSFYNKDRFDKGVIRCEFFYFSNLVQQNRFSIRQFASLNTVFGLKREPYEYITLNGSQLYGFNSTTVRGINKAILNLETVVYLPYNILGFRLAPVLFVGLGKIGYSLNKMLNSPIYQAYSLGLLVRNENLIFNTFELSIGIYPYLPGGTDGVRLNPIGNYSLRVKDFALPKPEIVGFY